ncbi:pyrimidine-nucleoside phosphorylase, partial [Paenibacillus sepulcri]|nr:pyrimidine-nucleoside phosphorylase [Paenibacillus sepulcri]
QQDGFVQQIDAEQLGLAAMLLGAGRAAKEDEIDHAVGLMLKRKVGDSVKTGDTIAQLHARDRSPSVSEVAQRVLAAYTIGGQDQPTRKPLLLSVVTSDGIKRSEA